MAITYMTTLLGTFTPPESHRQPLLSGTPRRLACSQTPVAVPYSQHICTLHTYSHAHRRHEGKLCSRARIAVPVPLVPR